MDTNIIPSVNAYSTGFDVSDRKLEELFPQVDPEFRPFGSRVLVQLRRVLSKTSSGIYLGTGDKQSEAWNMQVGKLIACGPLAFKNRNTGLPWSEGVWAQEGDFVRFPRWGGDRVSIDMNDGQDPVVVLIMEDHHLLGAYTGDVARVRTFIE